MGLSKKEMAYLSVNPEGRFVISHVADKTALATLVANASFLPGLSLFWYSGHKISTRCHDCANIDHHIQDDAILDWVA